MRARRRSLPERRSLGLVGVQHESPLPQRPALWKARAACSHNSSLMLIIAVTSQQLEAELAAGAVACPDCGEQLSRWGFGRSREVRMAHGTRQLTPRRTICAGCQTTHVLCPAWSLPRRRDAAAVIGQGHRPIAARLGRPPATVRGWLRAARARAACLRACASRWAYALDACQGPVTPAGSELGDAIEAIMLAARAWVLRFGPASITAWERAVWLTGGLLSGPTRAPP